MLLLRDAGYKIVGHIHDEVLIEVPATLAREHYNNVTRIMGIAPDWASNLPLRADGYVTPFYLKD